MASLRVDIGISAERYVSLYGGKVKTIHACTEDGRYVQFPGNILHRFVTHEGVYGKFELKFDKKQKLLSVKKVS